MSYYLKTIVFVFEIVCFTLSCVLMSDTHARSHILKLVILKKEESKSNVRYKDGELHNLISNQ